MNATLARTIRIILVVIKLCCGVNASAGLETMDVDAPFRAKIAKEKVRTAAEQRKIEEQEKSLGATQDQSSNCGSQNIGNIDTGGRIGTTPREEFVFAPNAINIVDRGACR
jgi:hypothetical protein